VRPGRKDIAIPPFPPGLTWIGAEQPIAERITARDALLVHFVELGELSSVRTLPFVAALSRQYAQAGLSVLGVHSPRNGLAAGDETLRAALDRVDVPYPVGNDAEHRIWHAYGCQGWPSSFLWGRGGTLRYAHFGEGAYHETERALRTELAGGEGHDLPAPVLEPPPNGKSPQIEHPSDEVFPGGSHETPWRPGRPGEPLIIEYAAGGASAALDGSGSVTVAVDEEEPHSFLLEGPGLYELSSHPEHGMHQVRLDLDGDIRVWSVSFAPGVRR
jgi:hypothetical protein